MQKPLKRILCVEDNEDICFMIETVLGREGYRVASAASPAKALEAAGRERFDLFILDTALGGESGLDLCRTLRANYPETQVIFYSAAVFDSDRAAALRAGASAYVTKPGTEGLVDTVRKVLGVD